MLNETLLVMTDLFEYFDICMLSSHQLLLKHIEQLDYIIVFRLSEHFI